MVQKALNILKHLKDSELAIYKSNPVIVKGLIVDNVVDHVLKARIEFIQRNKHKVGEIVVFAEELTPLTKQTAKELMAKTNSIISKCNLRLHAINECLRRM